MKARELEKCAVCDKGIAHAGIPMFFRVKVEQHILDRRAIERQHGLELMTGSPVLASVLGPDEDIAHGLGEHSMLVCYDCAAATDVQYLSAISAGDPGGGVNDDGSTS